MDISTNGVQKYNGITSGVERGLHGTKEEKMEAQQKGSVKGLMLEEKGLDFVVRKVALICEEADGMRTFYQ